MFVDCRTRFIGPVIKRASRWVTTKKKGKLKYLDDLEVVLAFGSGAAERGKRPRPVTAVAKDATGTTEPFGPVHLRGEAQGRHFRLSPPCGHFTFFLTAKPMRRETERERERENTALVCTSWGRGGLAPFLER